MAKQTLLLNALLLSALVGFIQAKPYYFFQTSKLEDLPQVATEAASQAKEQITGQLQQVTGGANQADQLPKRFQGHLNQLYNHGSSAVKGVVETVQPDLSNIGKDLSDAFQATRERVKGKLEPIAHTVRPYIDQAHKVVGQVSEQMRERISGAISKLNSASANAQGEVADKTKQASEQVQHTASNSINESAETVQHATQ